MGPIGNRNRNRDAARKSPGLRLPPDEGHDTNYCANSTIGNTYGGSINPP
jgi:hypothetical protein